MEDYNKIIESLGVKFIKARNIRILQPIRIKNYYDVENSLLILYKGEVSFGEEETQVEEGDMLFIPGGKMVSVTYGNAEKPKAVNNEEFMTHRELYFDQNNDSSAIGRLENSFGMVAFEHFAYCANNCTYYTYRRLQYGWFVWEHMTGCPIDKRTDAHQNKCKGCAHSRVLVSCCRRL